MDIGFAQDVVGKFIKTKNPTEDLGVALKLLADEDREEHFDLLYRAVEEGVLDMLTQPEVDTFMRALASNCTTKSYAFIEFSFRYDAAQNMSDEALEEVVYGLEADSFNAATKKCLEVFDKQDQSSRLSQGLRDSVNKRLDRKNDLPPACLPELLNPNNVHDLEVLGR